MDVTPPLAPSDTNSPARPLPLEVEQYLSRVSQEHHRFVNALSDANRDLGPVGQLAKVASIQTRLAQEFLDAQRAILKRRAETDAEVADIAVNAEGEAAALVLAAQSRARITIGCPLPPPPDGSLAAPLLGSPAARVRPSVTRPGDDANESLARLIDGAFDTAEPDGVAARRQLRELLDAWWEAEKQEAKAAADDAAARAAMLVHNAKIEAGEIALFTPPTADHEVAAVYRYQPPTALPTPMVDALDEIDHEHLDDLLAHLLDELDDGPKLPALPALPEASAGTEGAQAADGLHLVALAAPTLPPPLHLAGMAPMAPPVLPPPADSLNDRTAAPQEAFDRFWTGFGGSGTRRWVFPQLLLPAVAVVAVLALVLAVIG